MQKDGNFWLLMLQQNVISCCEGNGDWYLSIFWYLFSIFLMQFIHVHLLEEPLILNYSTYQWEVKGKLTMIV